MGPHNCRHMLLDCVVAKYFCVCFMGFKGNKTQSIIAIGYQLFFGCCGKLETGHDLRMFFLLILLVLLPVFHMHVLHL
jgi:hypothetical protein